MSYLYKSFQLASCFFRSQLDRFNILLFLPVNCEFMRMMFKVLLCIRHAIILIDRERER